MFKKLVSLFSGKNPHNSSEPLQNTVSAYRARFETSLIGTWTHATGTFEIVHDEVWEFFPDHTGKVTELGPFEGKRDEMLFVWKEVAPFMIACKVTQWWEEDLSDWLPFLNIPVLVDDEGNEVEEEEVWETIFYDFMPRATDTGEVIALYEVDIEGRPTNSFWNSNEQLTFCGGWKEGHQ